MSTFGNPARYACCFGEYEEESGWEPLHVEHGFSPGDSAVAALTGEPLQIVNDTKSRGAADLLTTIARSLQVVAHHKARSLGDALVVVGPEHVRTIANDGWSKGRVRQFLWEQRRKRCAICRRPQRRRRAPRADARVLRRRRERHDADPEVPRPGASRLAFAKDLMVRCIGRPKCPSRIRS
jgi:hypothetical protein